MDANKSFLLEIISKLEEIEQNTVDLDTKNEVLDLIQFVADGLE
jgi:hypothetical protein